MSDTMTQCSRCGVGAAPSDASKKQESLPREVWMIMKQSSGPRVFMKTQTLSKKIKANEDDALAYIASHRQTFFAYCNKLLDDLDELVTEGVFAPEDAGEKMRQWREWHYDVSNELRLHLVRMLLAEYDEKWIADMNQYLLECASIEQSFRQEEVRERFHSIRAKLCRVLYGFSGTRALLLKPDPTVEILANEIARVVCLWEQNRHGRTAASEASGMSDSTRSSGGDEALKTLVGSMETRLATILTSEGTTQELDVNHRLSRLMTLLSKWPKLVKTRVDQSKAQPTQTAQDEGLSELILMSKPLFKELQEQLDWRNWKKFDDRDQVYIQVLWGCSHMGVVYCDRWAKIGDPTFESESQIRIFDNKRFYEMLLIYGDVLSRMNVAKVSSVEEDLEQNIDFWEKLESWIGWTTRFDPCGALEYKERLQEFCESTIESLRRMSIGTQDWEQKRGTAIDDLRELATAFVPPRNSLQHFTLDQVLWKIALAASSVHRLEPIAKLAVQAANGDRKQYYKTFHRLLEDSTDFCRALGVGVVTKEFTGLKTDQKLQMIVDNVQKAFQNAPAYVQDTEIYRRIWAKIRTICNHWDGTRKGDFDSISSYDLEKFAVEIEDERNDEILRMEELKEIRKELDHEAWSRRGGEGQEPPRGQLEEVQEFRKEWIHAMWSKRGREGEEPPRGQLDQKKLEERFRRANEVKEGLRPVYGYTRDIMERPDTQATEESFRLERNGLFVTRLDEIVSMLMSECTKSRFQGPAERELRSKLLALLVNVAFFTSAFSEVENRYHPLFGILCLPPDANPRLDHVGMLKNANEHLRQTCGRARQTQGYEEIDYLKQLWFATLRPSLNRALKIML